MRLFASRCPRLRGRAVGRLRSCRHGRIYGAAAVGLLLLAAALRFWGLSEHPLWSDEGVAAINAWGSLGELLDNTRYDNSSPILYPIALWLVQKVAISEFSLRLLPAAASVLTVAVMLFLLPWAGVGRWTAFLAALLATLSTAAIQHAQDAREYQIDALLATLLIVGLLRYRQAGSLWLLGGSLLAAPLLQYGLVLFGAAVIAAAAVCPPRGRLEPNRKPTWDWAMACLRRRAGLVGPAAAFLVGLVITYAVTMSSQYSGIGSAYAGASGQYLYQYYYHGGADLTAALEWTVRAVLLLLVYHLPPAIAVLAAAAFGLLLLAALFRRRIDVLSLLAVFAATVAVAAAMLAGYPLGAIRQTTYLQPVLFLAVGLSFSQLVQNASVCSRIVRGGRLRRMFSIRGVRVWTLGSIAAAVAVAGVHDLRTDSPYRTDDNYRDVMALLDELANDGDVVYLTHYAIIASSFYQRELLGDYYYDIKTGRSCAPVCARMKVDTAIAVSGGVGRRWQISHDYRHKAGCSHVPVCTKMRVDALLGTTKDAGRIWLVAHPASPIAAEALRLGAGRIAVQTIVDEGTYRLYLVELLKEKHD